MLKRGHFQKVHQIHYFFSNFSKSMINEHLKFGPLAIFRLPKSMTYLGREKGPTKVQFCKFNNMEFFVIVSKYMKNQWLKFDSRAALALFKTPNGSDFYSRDHKIKKKTKKRIAQCAL